MLDTLRQRDFGLLWLAGLVSIAGDLALFVALPLHVYEMTGSSLATAGTLTATFLPGVVLGPVAGVFVDRWDRKRTMVVADLVRAVALLPLVAAPDALGVVYTVAAVQGTVGLFFGPAENAWLPRLVGEERLVTANALNSLNDNLGFLIGPAAGALVYAQSGIAGVVLADAASYAVSAVLIRAIAADGRVEGTGEPASGGSAWGRVVADLRVGLGVVRRRRALLVVFGASFLGNLGEGVFITLALSALVLDVLGGTPAQVGLLGSAQAVGGIAASVLVARYGARLSHRWLLGGGMALLGLADLAMFNARRVAGAGTPAIGVAMGCMVAAGPPAVASSAGWRAILQSETTDGVRGRVFGALGAVRGSALLIGFGVAGVFGDAIGIVPVLSAGALIRIGGGVVALVWLPRERSVADS